MKAPTYTPEKRNISELLTLTNPPIVVPNWQRNYSWKMQHVETFWQDLIKSTEHNIDEYFIGSIVIVHTSNNEYLLLDGQQRLATSAILLSVIRDYIKNYNKDASQDVHQKYLSNYDYDIDKITYKISLNVYDREFFRRLILTYRDADYTAPTPEHASHHLILKAREFFEEKFGEYWDVKTNKEAYEWSQKISKKLLRGFTLISVVSSDEDSAAQVFETLNDRGIGLSTPDLLKNLLMRRADESNHEALISQWSKILDFDSESRISNFIRHYWISNHGDVKTQSLYREIKSQVEEKDLDSVKLTSRLADASDLYRDVISGSYNEADCGDLIDDFNEFGSGANLLMPAVLAVLEKCEQEDKKLGLNLIINLYVRHSVIGQLENSRLENVVYLAARELRESSNFSAFCQTLYDAAPTDEQFKSAFSSAIVTKRGLQRYILRKIEGVRRLTAELVVAPPSKVHIEHIYPQTPQDGQRWKDHERWVNRIGNLTLLCNRLNSKIKNGEFKKKKASLQASEILITQDAAQHAEWSTKIISERQSTFSESALEIWKMEPLVEDASEG